MWPSGKVKKVKNRFANFNFPNDWFRSSQFVHFQYIIMHHAVFTLKFQCPIAVISCTEGWPFTRKTGPPPNYTIGKVLVQNVLILVSCASVWQTEARLTILWRNCIFKLCYEMVSCASVWQTEARLSHLDVFGGFLMGWNRLKQYGCASAQTIVFFMEGAPSTLHTILSGRGHVQYRQYRI